MMLNLMLRYDNIRNLCRATLYNFEKITICTCRNLSTKYTNSLSVLFYGTDDFSVESLKAVHQHWLYGDPRYINQVEVVTAPLKDVPLEVRKFSHKNNLTLHDWPYCPPKNKFDVGIVVSFGYMISKEIIDSFPLGVINVHASLLPRWRGAAPIFHALLNGDHESGVTIMQIDPYKFDTGKILTQQKYLIEETCDAAVMRKDLSKLGGDLLIQSLGNLKELLANGQVQDSSLATKAPKVKPEMANIKWQEHSCQHVDRLYRALADEMKPQTTWHGLLIKLCDIVESSAMEQINLKKMEEDLKLQGNMLRYGEVVYHKRRKMILVLCKNGWVGFRSILVKGKSQMNASEFYNGYISKVTPEQRYFE